MRGFSFGVAEASLKGHPSSIIKWLFNHASRQTQLEYGRVNLSLLERDSNAVFLDCGCSDGEVTLKAAERIGTRRIFGVDIRTERIDEARAKGIKVHEADLNEGFPFKSESFDVVHANQTIEHLNNTDGFIKECYRVLKGGGYAVVSTPNLASSDSILYLLLGIQPLEACVSDDVVVGSWHPNYLPKWRGYRSGVGRPGHRRLFTMPALEALFEYHGFKIEKSVASGFYPLPTILAKLMCLIDGRHATHITIKARKTK